MTEDTIQVHNPNNLPTIPYIEMRDLQGDLKILTEENRRKLRQSILTHGIFMPKFVWWEDRTPWVIDGHQTLKVLAELDEAGYVIPEIPIAAIEAEDKQDAAERLLQINSQYGTVNPVTSFFEELELEVDILEDLALPNLEFKGLEADDVETESGRAVTQEEVDRREAALQRQEQEREASHEEHLKQVICPECLYEFSINVNELQ